MNIKIKGHTWQILWWWEWKPVWNWADPFPDRKDCIIVWTWFIWPVPILVRKFRLT